MSANPKTRRNARLASVQALYQMDISSEPVRMVIRQFIDHRFAEQTSSHGPVDQEHFEIIVEGVVKAQKEIDNEVSLHLSKKWSLSRLHKTLRAVMRASTFELLHRPDVPALVIIDEYVAIAREFFEDKEAAFVNGALDRLARKHRASEFGVTASHG